MQLEILRDIHDLKHWKGIEILTNRMISCRENFFTTRTRAVVALSLPQNINSAVSVVLNVHWQLYETQLTSCVHDAVHIRDAQPGWHDRSCYAQKLRKEKLNVKILSFIERNVCLPDTKEWQTQKLMYTQHSDRRTQLTGLMCATQWKLVLRPCVHNSSALSEIHHLRVEEIDFSRRGVTVSKR